MLTENTVMNAVYINPTKSITTLYVNDLNVPPKRQTIWMDGNTRPNYAVYKKLTLNINVWIS